MISLVVTTLFWILLAAPPTLIILLMWDVWKSKDPKECNFLNVSEDFFYHTKGEKAMYLIGNTFLLVMCIFWIWVLFTS